MKLTGKLKKQVEAAATMEEKKEAIENAGMLLDDEELAVVAGGKVQIPGGYTLKEMTLEEYQNSDKMKICPDCGEPLTTDESVSDHRYAHCRKCKIQWKYRLFK